MTVSICGAHTKSTGNPCKKIAGNGTDHVGEGRCRDHGGATPVKHGLYSKVTRTRLGKRIAEIENDPDILDLYKELAMLKALAEQTVETYQRHEAALLAWHRAESPAYQILMNPRDALQVRDTLVELQSLEQKRPKERPDAKIVATLVGEIGRTQDRIRQAETVVTRGQMLRVFARMAGVVRQFTDEENTRKIRDGWMNLPREGR